MMPGRWEVSGGLMLNSERVRQRPISKRRVLLASLILLFVLLGVTIGLTHRPDADETLYHMPATLQYMQQFPQLDLRDYHSASGPLPYILLSFWARLFGSGMVSLRVAIMLFGMFSLVVLWRLLKDVTPGTQFLVTLFFFLHPYFLLRSFSLYTVAPAVLFGLLTLLFFEEHQAASRKHLVLLLYVLSASAAVLTRQEFLSYPLGLAIFASASRIPLGRRVFPQEARHSFLTLALMFVPVLILGLMLLYWGGSTPPRFSVYAGAGPNLGQIDFILLFLGFWYWPLFLDNFKLIPKWVYALALIIGIHLFWTPLYREIQIGGGPGGIIGAVYTWLVRLGFPVLLLKITQIVIWMLGVMVFSIVVRRRREPFALISIVHFLVMLAIPFVWERYYFAAFPAVWLAVRGDIKNRKLYVPLVLIQVGLLAQYFLLHV